MKASLEIRPAVPADYPGIARLLDRRLGAMDFTRRTALWEWRMARNPARESDFPAFIVASRGDEILGAHGLIPARVSSFGEHGRAAFACDFAVDESARNVGLRLKVAAMAPDLCDVAVSTSANAAARAVTVALGGRLIPESGVSYICPLRPERFVRGTLRRLAAGAAGTVLRVILRGRSSLSEGRNDVSPLRRFGSAIDDLWQRSAAADASLAVVRDAEYLNWRYVDYPFAETFASSVAEGDQVRALAVGQTARDATGRRAVLLGELLFEKGREAAGGRALNAVLGEALRRRADYVYGRFSAPAIAKLLRSRGFLKRGSSDGEFTVKSNRLARASEVERAYFTAGDGDCAYL